MCIKYEASSEKDMHKSGWMVPPRPNVPREIEEARQIAKDTYRKARFSKEEPEQQMSVLLPTARISYSNDWV